MRSNAQFRLSPAMAALCLLGCLVAAPALATAARYICPPCGQPCDTSVFDHPGACPKCGMTLVDASTVKAATSERALKRAAILVFNGVEIIDSMGPYEVLGAADFDVYTVGATKEPVTSAMGQVLVPKYSFSDAPVADVLVVPGGGVYGAQHDAATLEWVRSAARRAQLTMSVCNGAFILASAGLLDGLTATTTASNIERLRAQFPKVRVVEDQRFVDNGRIITTGGLSAGIDGALHVVERTRGKGFAQQVALGEEYDWGARARFARAALADRLIPHVSMDKIGTWEVVRTQGDTDRWEMVLQGTSALGPDSLLEYIDREFASHGKWIAVPPGPRSRLVRTRGWTFTGRDGEPWTGSAAIEAKPGTDHAYALTLTIGRRSAATGAVLGGSRDTK